ncbi:MAG: alpha/beta fold hydrolase [Microbacterium sp.]
MFIPRRAAPSFARSAARSTAIAGAAAFAVAGALGSLALLLARAVVTPPSRLITDVKVLGIDTVAQTITLSRTPDTVLPGRYGLFTTGTTDFLKIGAVLGESDGQVRRKLLTRVDGATHIGERARFSGWYWHNAAELHIPYSNEVVPTPLGPAPAWLFPGEGPNASTWVIATHGRGTRRAETLRAVPVLHDEGVSVLCVSYRNDGDAPRSRSGKYALGATEWRDVEAAVVWALRRGAERIVLMGFSMGGAISLQEVLNTAHREAIVGVMLDSPVVDWRPVVEYQAREVKLPGAVIDAGLSAVGQGWSAGSMHRGDRVSFDALDIVSRADELTVPILLMHSDDDGYVPSGPSHALAEARPDIVTMETFHTARHVKLWNYDESRWNTAIREWMHAHVL